MLLSGEAAQLPSTIVYTTGTQTISSLKNFSLRPTVNGTGILLSGEELKLGGSTVVYTTGDQTILGVKTFGDTTKIVLDPQGLKNEFILIANSGVSVFELVATSNSIDYDITAGQNTPLISGFPKLDILGNILLPSGTPQSTGDIGIKGSLTWDTGYLYLCIDTNSWKRVALSTW